MKILFIDNYDSFTYNLVDIFKQFDCKLDIITNNQLSIEEIKQLQFEAIVISPGPSNPENAGITLKVIEEFYQSKPIFGVCLGHQAIGKFFGANIVKTLPRHGKTSLIKHNNQYIFKGIKTPFEATRYHSLHIEKSSLPDSLEITALSEDGIIMGISHKLYNIHGVQFHPESIKSEYGINIIQNFLQGL